MTVLFLGLLAAFLLSAFFSCAEMAFVSADRVRLRKAADSGARSARAAMKLYEKPQRFLIGLLIGNNIVNIASTAIVTVLFARLFGIENQWVVTAVAAPMMIIFAEMIPKDLGRIHANALLTRGAFWLRAVFAFFYFPSTACLGIVNSFLARGSSGGKRGIFVNEEEFRSLIEESVRSGVVTRHQKKIIDTILDFERVSVSSVMVPYDKVPKAEINGTVGTIKEAARRTQSRMVLVYEEEPAIVVGMIYVYDLLFEPDDRLELARFLRPPIFLPGTTSIEHAFLTLQAKRQSYAVVMDVEGDVIGAVAIERLLTYHSSAPDRPESPGGRP
ncbi:MAG: CNNM domain-containing protein [Candidatus Omnitrophota bacterium]|jgi:CBS domain containing-hemolysin-like protein